MPLFSWEARTPANEARCGELAGPSELHVIQALRRQGLRVTRVTPRSLRDLPRPAPGAAPHALAAVLQDIIALRAAGLGPSEVLALAASRRRGPLARALHSMRLALDSGVDLGQAFGRHHDAFGTLGARSLAHAEARGTLDPTLSSFSLLLSHTCRIRDLLRHLSSRILLATLLLLAWLALLSGALLPASSIAFLRLGLDSSGPATHLISLAPCLSLATSILSALLALASATLAAAGWRRSLRLPLPGSLRHTLRRLSLARFARALATALTAELPRLQALELAAWEADDLQLGEVFLRARSSLSQGGDLADALADTALPQAFTRAALAAERSGALPGVLCQLADIEEDAALRWLSSRSCLIVHVLYGLTFTSALLATLALASPFLRA